MLVAPILPLEPYFIGAALCLVFVLINLAGAREAARFQVLLVLALLVLMVYFIAKGLPAVNVRHFEPFAPFGLRAVFSTTGFVFVSYGGLMKVASVAGEVKTPGRLIPLGMVMALLSIIVLYTLMILVTSGVLGAGSIVAMTSYAFSRAETAKKMELDKGLSLHVGLSPAPGGALATLVLKF